LIVVRKSSLTDVSKNLARHRSENIFVDHQNNCAET